MKIFFSRKVVTFLELSRRVVVLRQPVYHFGRHVLMYSYGKPGPVLQKYIGNTRVKSLTHNYCLNWYLHFFLSTVFLQSADAYVCVLRQRWDPVTATHRWSMPKQERCHCMGVVAPTVNNPPGTCPVVRGDGDGPSSMWFTKTNRTSRIGITGRRRRWTSYSRGLNIVVSINYECAVRFSDRVEVRESFFFLFVSWGWTFPFLLWSICFTLIV